MFEYSRLPEELIAMSESGERYDFCRLFVDGAGDAKSLEDLLAQSGRYPLVVRSLRRYGVSIDVRRNKNIPIPGVADFLLWPVTMEVFRDDDVSDATMLRVVRELVDDLKAIGGRVVVAAEFEDEV